MIGNLLVLVAISIRISTEHFTHTPAGSCELASKCNHTWVPICGQQQHDLNNRIFVDECDMHEYNCDNKITYIKVDLKTCSYKCTQRQLLTQNEEPHPSITTESTTVSIDKTTTVTNTKSTITHATITSEKTSTHPEEQNPYTSKSTIITINEPTTTTNIETNTIPGILLSEETNSQNNISTDSDNQPTTVEDPITTTTTTLEDPATTTPIILQPTNTTNKTTTTNQPINNNSTNNSWSITNSTEEVMPNEVETEAGTTTTVPLSSDAIKTKKTSASNVSSTTATLKNCTEMPKDCFVPSTWETTQRTESRDFYQILRKRFGEKVKFLKYTTHFPKPDIIVERIGDAFIPSHHGERINRRNI